MNIAVEDLQEKQQSTLAANNSTACINCGLQVDSPFCAACGQPKQVAKITWRNLGEELSAKLLGLDSQFARTVIGLTLTPGKVINRYLAGNRVSYLGPLGYYFIISALVLICFSLLEINMEEFIKASGSNFNTEVQTTGRPYEFQQQAFQIISGLFRFVVILFVPFFAIAALIMFRKKGYNFLEHSVMLIYSSAHLFIATLGQATLYKFTGQVFTGITLFLTFLYYGYFYANIMTYKRPVYAFLKGLAVLVIGYIIFILALAVVIFAVILMDKLI